MTNYKKIEIYFNYRLNIIKLKMDLPMYNNYKQSNIMCDEQYNYIIISLLISYSIFISVIMLIKQSVKVIKKFETQENNEEELLLANYNTPERVLILQSVYKEQLSVLFEKQINNYKKLNTYCLEGRCLKEGHLLREKINGTYPTDIIVNKLTVNDLLLGLIDGQVYQSMIQDIQTTNKEIIIIAKKAGLFEATSDLLNDLQKYIKPSNPFYNEYRNVILNM